MSLMEPKESKKENKVWGEKHKQPYVTLEKKTTSSLAFDQPHTQQA